jgi:hypothetical protein
LLLLADAFNPLPPTFELDGVKCIGLGNLVWNYKDRTQEVPLPDAPLDKTTFDAVNAALDHFRDLSQANLQQ